jgi:hypothetical protein
MQPGGNEVVLDEAGDALLRIDLGIQPSTTASHRRGAEIQEYGFLPGACIAEYLINVMPPRYRHPSSSCLPDAGRASAGAGFAM